MLKAGTLAGGDDTIRLGEGLITVESGFAANQAAGFRAGQLT